MKSEDKIIGILNSGQTIPIPMTVRSVSLDLVSVQPMSDPGKISRKSKKQKLKEARINKLRKLNGKNPNIILPDDIKEDCLFYLDHVYQSGNTQNNI